MMQYDFILRLILTMFNNQNTALQNALNIISEKPKIDDLMFHSLKHQVMLLLRKVHVTLNDYSHELSTFFSFPIFLCIFFTFVLSVTYFYATLIIFMEESKFYQLYWFIWPIAFILEIVFLCRNVSKLNDEVQTI